MRFELAPPQDRFENDCDQWFPPTDRSRLDGLLGNSHPIESCKLQNGKTVHQSSERFEFVQNVHRVILIDGGWDNSPV